MRLGIFILAALTFAPAIFAQTKDASANPNNVRITHGPTVEFVTADRAVVAWSTNVSSGTIVLYGTSADALTQQAKMPWGSLTHRVTLKKLQPDTHYFFQVRSGDGAGTGTEAHSEVLQFSTRSASAAAPAPASNQ